jgi:hypothetical protein
VKPSTNSTAPSTIRPRGERSSTAVRTWVAVVPAGPAGTGAGAVVRAPVPTRPVT